MDIAEPESVERALNRYHPWAIINPAGYEHVDLAEDQPDECFRSNIAGPVTLAAACARHGIKLVTFSTAMVFDGPKSQPYVESDQPQPTNIYAESKSRAEREVLRLLPQTLVIRTGEIFGPGKDFNFVSMALQKLAAGQPFSLATDALISPTYLTDLVQTSLDLLIDDEQGLWHLANRGAVSWYDLACQAARYAGFSNQEIESLFRPVSTEALSYRARRPRYSVLGSERGYLMPGLEPSLEHYCTQHGFRETLLKLAN